MKIPTDAHFGAMVQEYREIRNLSKTDFASKLRDAGLTNFHPTTVTRVEKGERPVKLGEAAVIAQVLETQLGDLVDVPLEPWDVLRQELEEYGERAETYAKWSAYWEVAMKEFELDTLRIASELEELIKDGGVPQAEVEGSAHLIDKYRKLADEDRLEFWREHIRALGEEERRDFHAKHVYR